MSEGFTRVGSLAEVPEGEARAFDLAGERVCVVHVGPGVMAVADACTHRGCSLGEEGSLTSDGEGIECGCHGAIFDLKNGEPLEGPATDPLSVFSVRVEDGWIEVGPRPNE